MNLSGEIVIVTGGCGFLGRQFMQAVHEINGLPISLDIRNGGDASCDITKEEDILKALQFIKAQNTPIYGLINNAAINPKFDKDSPNSSNSRLEGYSRHDWDLEISVGLTGAFLCTKVFGSEIAKNGRGSIINISSDLGLIAPNQELYKQEGLTENEQPVKPVTYSIIKHGIIGLTKYTATYWAHRGIRCNALALGGVYNNHPTEFLTKLSKLIPMGRMANKDEYNEAVKFLLTEASSFVNGHTLVIDGGRSIW